MMLPLRPIEPFALSLGSRVRLRRHLGNLPTELNAASVTALQLRPGRLGPVAPGGNDFEIVSDAHCWIGLHDTSLLSSTWLWQWQFASRKSPSARTAVCSVNFNPSYLNQVALSQYPR